MKEYIIGKNDASMRVDRFLIKTGVAPSGAIYKAFRKKDVKVDGHWVKEDYVLCEGDKLRIYLKETENNKIDFIPCKVEAEIVCEDDNIIIFDKPKSLPCQPDSTHKSGTLVDMLKSYLYEKGEFLPQNENIFSPALCNRLDTNTSGLVIGAKNAQALRDMNEQIRLRNVKKYYMCTLEGVLDKKNDKVEAYIQKDERLNKSEISSLGKSISMEYRVISSNDSETKVEVLLHTGRSHQIRAYFASIGHPLKGDKKYGAKSGGGQSLVSYKIIFDFPKSYEGCLSSLRGKEYIKEL